MCGLSAAGCGSGSLTRDQTWAPAWGLQEIVTGPLGKAHDCFRLCFHLLTQDAQVLPSPAPSPQVEGSLLVLPACQIAAEVVAAVSPRYGLCWWLSGKESAFNAEMRIQSLGQEDPCGGGNGYPLQYSCPENPMDGGGWQAIQPVGSQRVRQN